MRRATVILAVLLFCVPLYGADYYHLWDQVTTKSGYAVSGATVNVYNPNTEVNPTAYTDLAGDTPVSWPLTTDSGGMFECYLADGNYDINIVHSGWDISTTWDNYMVGAVTSASTDTLATLTVTGVSTLGDAVGDTIKTRGNFWMKGNDIFRDWANDALWLYEVSGTRRLSAERDRILGIGGSVQFEEDGGVNIAIADVAHDGTFDAYDDTAILQLAPRDTSQDFVYQAVQFKNSRGDTNAWRWQNVHGSKNGDVGVVPYAFRFETDMPDSNGTNGDRAMMQLRWTFDDSATVTNHIRSSASSWLTMLEHDSYHYAFYRDQLALRSRNSEEKKLTIYGASGGNNYTILTNDGSTATNLRCTAATLAILDYDESDDATVKVQHLALVTHATDGPPDTTGIAPNTFWADGDTLWWRPKGAAFIQIAP